MLINKLLTRTNYTPATNKKNEYIVIHYTANNGDTAKNNCKYFLDEYRSASANYFVDENSIYQCVKDDDIAWHVGAKKYYNGCRNNNSIGIELCSRKHLLSRKYYFKDETINNAIELTALLMRKYKIPLDHLVRHFDCTREMLSRTFCA